MEDQQNYSRNDEFLKKENGIQQNVFQKNENFQLKKEESEFQSQSQSESDHNDLENLNDKQENVQNNFKKVSQAYGPGNSKGGGSEYLGKSKSKTMNHSGSNLQGNSGNSHNTNSNNHLFLTAQGNNINVNSATDLINFYGGQYKHIDQFPKIQEAYGQLNNLVDFLELKVDDVIERHEAEFLLAYKNHMFKIRKELQEMKARMDEQERKLKSGDKIDQMEKQLAWFRDESLKLYDKLGQKDKQIADYKNIIADQKKDISFQEGQIQSLKKKVRLLVKKVSGTLDNFNPNDRSASSVSAQNYFLSGIEDNMNENCINDPNLFNIQNYIVNNVKGSSSNSFINQSRIKRPHSSEYSFNQTKHRLNIQTDPGNNLGISSNNNLSNMNFQFQNSINQNTNNNQSFLQGYVVEQNETQQSQLKNYDTSSVNCQIQKNTKYQENKQEGWLPQSDFIAEMIVKYQNDQYSLVREITHMFKIEEEKKQKQVKSLKERLDKVLKEKLTQNVIRSDLENFFLECIETVRKQIIKRKPPPKNGENQLNFYMNQIKDYSVFRNEDKIKILELLLSNERLLMFVYQKIFPQNFNKLMNQIITQTQFNQTTDLHENQDIRNNEKPERLNSIHEAEQNKINLDTEDLHQVLSDIGIESQLQQNMNGTRKTSQNSKLGIQLQIEKISRNKSRDLDQGPTPLNRSNRAVNRHITFTQYNQFGNKDLNNTTTDEGNLILNQTGIVYKNNKKPSNKSFSIDPTITNNTQISSYQPNSVKQKLNCLINNDFSFINSSNRPSFKSKKASYKIY